MKILITTDLFTVKTNGVVTSVRNLMEELENKGHDVRVLTLSENRHSHKDKNIYYITSMPLGVVYPDVRMPLTYRHPLIRELIDWKPDVIHSQCEYFSYQFARRISKRTGAPIVHTYHTLYEQYVTYVIPNRWLGKHLIRCLSRWRLKKAGAIVAPTHKVEHVLNGYSIKNPIRVIPSGISLEQHKVRISDAERLERRRALGISGEQIVLINLGRLGNEKNLDEVVTLFAKARKTNDKLVLLIVGGGPAMEHLQKLVRQLGVSESVIFTGMIDPKEVHIYYQLGDLFVSASTSETQGLTYVEAAANGLPLLCRRDLCLQGVLREGCNGYAYDTDTEFFSCLQAILQDPQWMQNAKANSEAIAETFDKTHFAASIEDVYSSVLAAT